MRIVQIFFYIMLLIMALPWVGFFLWYEATADLKSVREDIRRILRGR